MMTLIWVSFAVIYDTTNLRPTASIRSIVPTNYFVTSKNSENDSSLFDEALFSIKKSILVSIICFYGLVGIVKVSLDISLLYDLS